MPTLRREVLDALEDDGWDISIQAGKSMRGDPWKFRHDLLTREVSSSRGQYELELLLLVVSDHPSRRLSLNMQTWYHALEQRMSPSGIKAKRRKMRVVLAQDCFQRVISSTELHERLRTISPVTTKKPADTYWPISVAVS